MIAAVREYCASDIAQEYQQAFTANSKYITRPIVNEYCEGMLKSTPSGGLKALETNQQQFGYGMKGMKGDNK